MWATEYDQSIAVTHLLGSGLNPEALGMATRERPELRRDAKQLEATLLGHFITRGRKASFLFENWQTLENINPLSAGSSAWK